jgi:hypothetical protein
MNDVLNSQGYAAGKTASAVQHGSFGNKPDCYTPAGLTIRIWASVFASGSSQFCLVKEKSVYRYSNKTLS